MDDMSIRSDFSFFPTRSGECFVREGDDLEDIVTIEWMLESYLPLSSSKYISSKVDQKSIILVRVEYLLESIDEVSFADTTELYAYSWTQGYTLCIYLDTVVSDDIFR